MRPFWIIWIGPKCVQIRDIDGGERHREGGVNAEAEIGVMQPQPRMSGAPRSWKRKGVDSTLEPSEEMQPCNTLILGF